MQHFLLLQITPLSKWLHTTSARSLYPAWGNKLTCFMYVLLKPVSTEDAQFFYASSINPHITPPRESPALPLAYHFFQPDVTTLAPQDRNKQTPQFIDTAL